MVVGSAEGLYRDANARCAGIGSLLRARGCGESPFAPLFTGVTSDHGHFHRVWLYARANVQGSSAVHRSPCSAMYDETCIHNIGRFMHTKFDRHVSAPFQVIIPYARWVRQARAPLLLLSTTSWPPSHSTIESWHLIRRIITPSSPSRKQVISNG